MEAMDKMKENVKTSSGPIKTEGMQTCHSSSSDSDFVPTTKKRKSHALVSSDDSDYALPDTKPIRQSRKRKKDVKTSTLKKFRRMCHTSSSDSDFEPTTKKRKSRPLVSSDDSDFTLPDTKPMRQWRKRKKDGKTSTLKKTTTNIAIKTFPSDIKVLTSKLSADEQANLKADVLLLGGVIVDEWSDTCTHLVMQNVTFTAKVMQSLCLGIPIVTCNFFKALLVSNQFQHKLPEVESFQPSIINLPKSLIGANVSLKVNVERKRLFAGKTFVFMTQRHMDVYMTMIECAMGKCIYVEGKTLNRNTLVEPGIIVIDNPAGSVHSQFFMEAVNRLKDFLRSKESGMVPDSDISLAILHCSLEKFCNPKQQFEESLETNLRLLSTNAASVSKICSYLDGQDIISFAEVLPVAKTIMNTEASPSTKWDDVALRLYDLDSLEPKAWITDGVINYYLAKIYATCENNDVEIIPTFIATALQGHGSDQWEQFLESYKLKSKSLVIFPLTDGTATTSATHWFLIVYSKHDRACRYYDSKYYAQNYQSYHIKDFIDKLSDYTNTPISYQPAKCLRQCNDYDCGIHLLMNAEHIVERFIENNFSFEKSSFTHAEVAAKRIQIKDLVRLSLSESRTKPQSSRLTTSADKVKNSNNTTASMPQVMGTIEIPSIHVDTPIIKNIHQDPPISTVAVHNKREQKPIVYPVGLKPQRRRRKRKRDTYKRKHRKQNYYCHTGVKTKIFQKVPKPKPTKNLTTRTLPKDPFKNKTSNKVHNHYTKPLAEDEELFTVVCGLRSFIRTNNTIVKKKRIDDALYEEFENHATIISSLSIEASYMIYKHFTDQLRENQNMKIKEKPKFREFYACLKVKTRGETGPTTRANNKNYFDLRRANGITNFYDGSNKTNAICKAADLYEVNFHNNIVDHMYNRVKRFFNKFNETIESFDTLDYLFNKKYNKKKKPNKILVNALRKVLLFKGNFWSLSTKWWSFIPFAYRLQQWFRTHQFKSFKVFPILHNKRHHVSYDGQTFQQFLRTWNLSPNSYYTFRNTEDDYWKRFFNIENYETAGHKFHNSIKTDGVSVSITMKRKKHTATHNDIQTKLENGQISNVFGLDPGERLSFAGVCCNLETGRETNIRYSSASFRYDSGEHRLTQKYHQIMNPLLNRIRSDREQLPDHASSMADPDVFLNFQLANLTEWQRKAATKQLTKLRFQRYVQRKKAIDAVAKEIIQKANVATINTTPAKKTLIFVGSTNTSSIIKGYVRVAKKAICNSMKRFAYVVSIHEFRSTMLCSQCFQPAVTSTSPHRWQYCKYCKITWNRDINAGRNIFYLGMQTLSKNVINRGFSKAFDFEKTAKGYKYVDKLPTPNTKRNSRKLRKLLRKQICQHPP